MLWPVAICRFQTADLDWPERDWARSDTQWLCRTRLRLRTIYVDRSAGSRVGFRSKVTCSNHQKNGIQMVVI